ncbi:Zn-dependent protease with chaperone function [Actinoalloteichus hoggarensis]|uniref:Heat shock protein HtpX n=1 Tax=Actinoalloteichus hoggarensis TaxID=1470176 RepID=A0A221W480_9PSEU|nr:M48 family metalloprotease [Actinoalloteichus hoggarensis]ASO20574.1 heat shock protein HtpX [Actinoalloteichus hoggarensis]MBB5923615.1 Zn-dependent protease with chaperone function [Actinoalloteichus hoggarensis]
MNTHGSPSRVDERALSAGTTVRFVLLVALLVMSSSLMVLHVALALSAYDGFGCSLAAGVAPGIDSAADVIARRGLQWEAYRACSIRYAPPPPWWVLPGWWAVLALLTALVFWALSRWKARRGRAVPLAAVDHDGAVARVVAELAEAAGLRRPPRVVIDVSASSAGAVVFGRTGRATVRLHGGLLALRAVDPLRFRAVLSHEFAHIANGDVTITYLTVALWRVYLGVALPPFLLWCVLMFQRAPNSPVWSSEAPIVTRGLLLTALLTMLVYLARADVLRSREVYADLTAVRRGADPTGWSRLDADDVGTRRRLLRAFLELWRTHPRWEVRRRALTDPAVLFGVYALPLFLTGAAATITHSHTMFALTQYAQLSSWAQHGAALAAAALVAGVVGVALWRAVVFSALIGVPGPSSIRAGLWLGLGMMLGGLAAGQGTINEWLPARPWVFLLLPVIAVAFTSWSTHCARLWVVAWRGRSLRGVMLLSVAAASSALSVWFVWWQTQGVAAGAGWWFDVAGVRDDLVTYLLGTAPDDAPVTWVDTAFVTIMNTTTNVLALPFAIAALIGLWVVPMLAWWSRPGIDPPRWALAALAGDRIRPGPPLPAFRRVLLPGVCGGVLGAAIVVAPVGTWFGVDVDASPTAFVTAELFGMQLAFLVAAAAAAAVARRTVPEHRLAAALIAAGTATLLCFGALLLSRVSDGCIPPFALADGACSSETGVARRLFDLILLPALPFVLLTAGLVGAPRSVSARRAVRPRTIGPARAGVLVLLVGALAVSTVAFVQRAPVAGRVPTPAEVQQASRQAMDAPPDGPVPASTRAMQVEAWFGYGGDDLLDDFSVHRRDLFAAVTAGVEAGATIAELHHVRPHCTEIVAFAEEGVRYFRVPDPSANELWESFLVLAWQAGRECEIALDADQAEDFDAAMQDLVTAQNTGDRVLRASTRGRDRHRLVRVGRKRRATTAAGTPPKPVSTPVPSTDPPRNPNSVGLLAGVPVTARVCAGISAVPAAPGVRAGGGGAAAGPGSDRRS